MSTGWKKKRRQEHLPERKNYYIFCEGEQTEPQYFSGFKRLIEENPIYKNAIQIQIEPCAAETMRVIGRAERYAEQNHLPQGQIWCVYDKDSFPASDFNGVAILASQLNQRNPNLQYHAAWSNECIEFWFILHFAYYTSNNHRKDYITFLNRKFQELGFGRYQKNMRNLFDILMDYGNPKNAIRYATRIMEDHSGQMPDDIAPGTRVYELVQELAQYLPETQKSKFL